MSQKKYRQNPAAFGLENRQREEGSIGPGVSETPVPVVGITTHQDSQEPVPEKLFVTVDNTLTVNLRKAASLAGEILKELPKGERLVLTHMGSVWSNVQTISETPLAGFVMTAYLTSE